MKNFSKKLSAVIIAFVALFVMLPAVSAQAASTTQSLNIPKKATITLYNKKDLYVGTGKSKMNEQLLHRVYINAKVTNLKSSNNAVLTVKKYESAAKNMIYTHIYANAKKAGTSTVSFKVNNKTYKTKVTVKKYINPISYIKVGNTKISGSRFNSTANYNLKYAKYAGKKTKITIKLAKGWDFYYHDYTENGEKGSMTVYSTAKAYPKSLTNGKTIKIKGTKGYTFHITVVQKSTGRTEDISVILK